jgi:hypothetical protein
VRGIEVTLPGGLLKNGRIERQTKFRPLTGRIEQQLIEFGKGIDRSGYVTAVLGFSLDRIGNEPVDAKRVSDLCVADRQYLMLRLAAMLYGEQVWLNVACGHCNVLFDVEMRRCDLPLKEAGQGFPQVTLHMKEWVIELRVPTGADQERIATQSDEEAMQQLLQSCIRSVNGEPPDREFINNLSESDIDAIDQALDEISPAVCDQLLVTCPECGREQRAELDHYNFAGLDGRFFYDEVHTLASHYHWSEAEILDLPKARRRMYLDMINRSAGMTEQG